MKFTKMHGAGNDYIYVNCFEQTVPDPEKTARFVSDRHFGIGADGLILIAPSESADVRMIMYNADGSRGKMCGNGVRCVGKYAYDHGLAVKPEITVETDSGIKTLTMQVQDGRAVGARVDMGAPILRPSEIPMDAPGDCFINQPLIVDGKTVLGCAVSMGNPHLVVHMPEIDTLPLDRMGPKFEHHPLFPQRVNTEFIQVINPGEIKMRVWERGSGETLACGTGACASVVAGALAGKHQNEVLVHLLGGNLVIAFDPEANRVWMAGPAVEVFTGEIPL